MNAPANTNLDQLFMSGAIPQSINTIVKDVDAISAYKKAMQGGKRSIDAYYEEFSSQYPAFVNELPDRSQYGSDFNSYVMDAKPVIDRIVKQDTGEKAAKALRRSHNTPEETTADLMESGQTYPEGKLAPDVYKQQGAEKIAGIKTQSAEDIAQTGLTKGVASAKINQGEEATLDESGKPVFTGEETPALKVKRENADAAMIKAQTSKITASMRNYLLGKTQDSKDIENEVKAGTLVLNSLKAKRAAKGKAAEYTVDQNTIDELDTEIKAGKALMEKLNQKATSRGELPPEKTSNSGISKSDLNAWKARNGIK